MPSEYLSRYADTLEAVQIANFAPELASLCYQSHQYWQLRERAASSIRLQDDAFKIKKAMCFGFEICPMCTSPASPPPATAHLNWRLNGIDQMLLSAITKERAPQDTSV